MKPNAVDSKISASLDKRKKNKAHDGDSSAGVGIRGSWVSEKPSIRIVE